MTKRCSWAISSEAMMAYHDNEWGKASHDDRYLFELLVLEGAQAGLSWSTVLNKRDNYRSLLSNFDVEVLSTFSDTDVERLMGEAGLVRNRLKLKSLRINAEAFKAVSDEYGSFASYLWSWTDGKPVRNRPTAAAPAIASTELSDAISKDLKKRGFKFVGTTIVYAYLQAVGVVDDHIRGCLALKN